MNLVVCEAHEATTEPTMRAQLKHRMSVDSSIMTSVGLGQAAVRRCRQAPKRGWFTYFIYRKGTDKAKPVKLVHLVDVHRP